MELWQSIPFACILLPLGSAAATAVLKPRAAKAWTTLVTAILCGASAVFLGIMLQSGTAYTYPMGHFPAPWGNELRAGVLEAVAGLFFSLVLLLSQLGGLRRQGRDILRDKQPLFCATLLLLLTALMAQTYTNDIFTAYVFLEIMTIAACTMMTARTDGRTLVAATRYMILNLVGSGLFLLGIAILYCLTGHLLMEQAGESVLRIYRSGEYHLPMQIVVGLMTVGLAVKSALLPFHTWVPDAYSYATPTGQAALSSLVCKGYIFLLMKIYIRVFGFEVLSDQHMARILFLFALAAMVIGSAEAIRQTDIRRMIAYSSVAQIGYIYMGIGLGTEAGMAAAFYHLIGHGICKSMLFIAADSLSAVNGGRWHIQELRGAGYRAPMAGIAFSVGAMSMVGFPFLPGFTSKLNFAAAGLAKGGTRMWMIFGGLVISTLLNSLYYLPAMIALWRRDSAEETVREYRREGWLYRVSMGGFVALNLLTGLFSQWVMDAIDSGMSLFG